MNLTFLLFDVPADWIWLIIFVVAFMLEVTSPELISLWFSAGALAALLTAALGGNLFVQFIVFFVVTVACLLTIGRWARKKLLNKEQTTNVDSLVGKDIVVIKGADYLTLGEGKVNGVIWSISCNKGEKVVDGEIAVIDGIVGNRLIVKAKK